jgi:hypothetical protein
VINVVIATGSSAFVAAIYFMCRRALADMSRLGTGPHVLRRFGVVRR